MLARTHLGRSGWRRFTGPARNSSLPRHSRLPAAQQVARLNRRPFAFSAARTGLSAKLRWAIALLPLLAAPVSVAQESTAPLTPLQLIPCCSVADARRIDASSPTSSSAHKAEGTRRTRWRTTALLSGYAAAVGVYGYFSWWDKQVQRHVVGPDGSVTTETLPNRTSNFRVSDEGWFGRNTETGGADKLGHAFSFYVSTRLLTSALDKWAGRERDDAIWLAGLTSAGVSLAVEVFDGYTQQYGFSKADLAMNLVGIGAGMLLESSPKWDDIIDLRWQYWRSADAKWLGERDPIADYSGHTYLLVLKASGFETLRSNPWLRFLELQAGYGSRGYAPHPGRFAPIQPRPHRNLYIGIGLNLSELLGATVFDGSSRTRRVTEGFLEYLQVPGANALWRYGLDD